MPWNVSISTKLLFSMENFHPNISEVLTGLLFFFFFGFLATTVPPTGCCSAVYAQVLHTRMPALLVSLGEVWWYCPAITPDQNTATDELTLLLQSLLNNKSVLTSLLQQWQRCRWWCIANLHHRCHSRGLLSCLCLRNRTWKVAGAFYAKNH